MATGRSRALVVMLRTAWRRALLMGLAAPVAHGVVLVAVRPVPVGYVAARRESSVVLVAIAGWRLLGERHHRRRIAAAAVVAAGLVVLVVLVAAGA